MGCHSRAAADREGQGVSAAIAKAWHDRAADLDYGSESHLLFVCFVRSTGECWSYQSRDVRLERNITGGIRTGDEK